MDHAIFLLCCFFGGMFSAAVTAFVIAFMKMDTTHPSNIACIILAPLTLMTMFAMFIADKIATVMLDIQDRRM